MIGCYQSVLLKGISVVLIGQFQAHPLFNPFSLIGCLMCDVIGRVLRALNHVQFYLLTSFHPPFLLVLYVHTLCSSLQSLFICLVRLASFSTCSLGFCHSKYPPHSTLSLSLSVPCSHSLSFEV